MRRPGDRGLPTAGRITIYGNFAYVSTPPIAETQIRKGARVAALQLSSRMGVSSSPSSRGPYHPTRYDMRFRKGRHHGIRMDIHDEDPTLASTPSVSCTLIATDSPWNLSTPLRQAASSTTSAAARSSDTASATSSLRDISVGLPRLIPMAR